MLAADLRNTTRYPAMWHGRNAKPGHPLSRAPEKLIPNQREGTAIFGGFASSAITSQEREGEMSAIDLNIRTPRGVLACVFVAVMWTVFLSSALAQMTITGRFSGTVLDTSGAAIPGVTVAVVNLGTGLTRTVTTDARGFYVVTDLPVGNYSLTAEQKSFGREIRTGYHIDPDARVTVDFTLRPGAVTETVEVTGTGETVNTTSGEISRVVDAKQVETLPLNGRNYGQLVTLMPGVA